MPDKALFHVWNKKGKVEIKRFVPELAFLAGATSLILPGEAGGGEGVTKLGTVVEGSVGGNGTEVGEGHCHGGRRGFTEE